ncbi:ATP-dependent RNA helicase HrpA [Aquipuribacter nitratireducens]|uniref:ATP-dependent RNA helicase HrpA n=1 Tax=Aquipuribacter nitratireducens TaxID=650104 RepID=A0ABW0GPY0_9MICO
MPNPTRTSRRGRGRRPGSGHGTAEQLAQRLARQADRLAAAHATLPPLRYPEELPVVGRREELVRLIRDNQVVVVAGATGSGKTTQLPKLALEAGRGRTGIVGHTQPRRIAARSVAERLAEEVGTPLGEHVGYQVRFTDDTGPSTLVKVMTDGILLAEIQRDPMLRRYDTIVVDEAHERSLNVDVLLGYLHRLLPKRPDLHLVITSATIDPQKFADHFGGAPVVEVSGRTYPVEIRYRPYSGDEADPGDDRDEPQAVVDAVTELLTEGDGDVLVFCSGEREIREAVDALRAQLTGSVLGLEVLPLYARLSAADQHRIFAPHTGTRVVVSTNVAETSLTVPGIRYVVDTGLARISRYSVRTKVQRLPVEPISQASATQRAGRSGRLAPGVAIRLYGEADHDARPEFTEPEVRRTNLASVLLQLTSLGIDDVEELDWLDPPDPRQVKDGLALLEELGAVREELEQDDDGRVTRHRRLTDVGRTLARLPVDPRLGRMLLEADRTGCLDEVRALVAGLSVVDPRQRPTEEGAAAAAAEQAHRRFRVEHSDLLTLLALWRYLRARREGLSSSAFRRLCVAEHLHHLRVREWFDLEQQLRQVCREAGMRASSAIRPGDEPGPAADARDFAGFEVGAAETIHRALLPGLLSHVGFREGDATEYLGARGTRFSIGSGSVLPRPRPAQKRPGQAPDRSRRKDTSPRWVMATELVETARLYARGVAAIDPAWIEPVAGHLVKRTYSEPRWNATRGQAEATEKVTLYGIPVVAARTVGYARVDPALSRELFLRHALVEGDTDERWTARHRFLAENARLMAEVREIEERTRRRDVVVDDTAVLAFYDARVPADVVSARHFDSWWKQARQQRADLLTMTRDDVLAGDAGPGRSLVEQFPDHLDAPVHDGRTVALPVAYRFEPGAADDGVTVSVPVEVLPALDADVLGWLVPGLREELVTALVRSLPKALRRSFAPAPDHAAGVLARVAPDGVPPRGDVRAVVARALTDLGGPVVRSDDLDVSSLPAHLVPRVRVVDAGGTVLAEGAGTADGVAALRRRLAGRVQDQLSAVTRALEVTGLGEVPDGPAVPEVVERSLAGHTLRGWPAWEDEGTTLGVRVLPSRADAVVRHDRGVRRAVLLGVAPPVRQVVDRLDLTSRLALSWTPYRSVPDLLADCVVAATTSLLRRELPGGTWAVRDAAAVRALRETVRQDLPDALDGLVRTVARVQTTWQSLRDRLDGLAGRPDLADTVADARAQLAWLVPSGYVRTVGADRMPHLLRYLAAVERRLDAASQDPTRDLRLLDEKVLPAYDAYLDVVDTLPDRAAVPADLLDVRWMVEELRVSVFAQQLGTAHPVSEKRIRSALAAWQAGAARQG